MHPFTIRLIQNNIDLAAHLVTLIGRQFASYTLSIAIELSQAINEPEPVDVILLNVMELSGSTIDELSALAEAYNHPPIILLVPPNADEQLVMEALKQGADDYVPVSETGLLVLTRRLVAIYSDRAEQQKPPNPINLPIDPNSDAHNDLAIVLISPDYRIKTWNSTAESLFDIAASEVLDRSLHELPFSPERLCRLKDIVDQTRLCHQPVLLSSFALDGPDAAEQFHVHAYPTVETDDVCLVVTPLSKTELLAEPETMRFSHDLQDLAEVLHRVSDQLTLNEKLDLLLEQATALLRSSSGQIFFLEKDNQKLRLIQAIGFKAAQLRDAWLAADTAPLDKLIAQSRPQMLRGQQLNPPLPYSDQDYLLLAPLTAFRGRIGLLAVSRAGQPFSTGEHYLLDSLAQQTSLIINNARLYEQTERSLVELSILDEASRTISSHWDNQLVLKTLIEQLVQAIGVSRGFIASWDRKQNKSHIQAEFHNELEAGPLEPDPDLTQRATLITLISQKRPVFLYRNNPALDEVERQVMEQYNGYARLLIPLVARGESIGWVELWDSRPERTFDASQVRLARALCSQVAIALQNLMYLEQSQRTLEETTALYRVASILTTRQDQQAIIGTVLQEFLQAMQLKQGAVVMFDFNAKCGIVKARSCDQNPVRPPWANANRLSSSNLEPITEGYQIPLQNNPVYEQIMRTGQPVTIDNPKADWLTKTPSFASSQSLPPVGGWGDPDAFCILVIPVRIREAIVGTLVADNTRHNRVFDDRDISTGQAMADQLGIGLQNVQLYESEYRRREQAETLREVAAVVSSSLNLREVLERILDELGRVIQYDSAGIHLIEHDQRRVIAGRGFPNVEEHIGLTYPIRPEVGWDEPGAVAIQTRKPLVFGDVSKMTKAFGSAKHSHVKSWMGIPLVAHDKVIGLISIDHSQLNAYTDEDVELATAFANQVAMTLENARLHEIEIRDIERELTIAHEIQETLLPQFIPQIPGLDIAGRIVPARQVGGDFFHFFSTKPEELGVAIGDVSGKGIPAALYMAAGITAIDTQTSPEVSPGELLNKLNTKLFNRLRENKMNIALQIATFEPLPPEKSDDGEVQQARGSLMTAASAGMIAPIGATVHGCRYLPVGGLPIGALPAAQYTYQDDMFLLDPFTTIIFTSDGIVEAQNENGELFGFERLEQTILEIVDSRDAQIITDHIIDAAQHFTGDAEQNDDMTVVVVVKK